MVDPLAALHRYEVNHSNDARVKESHKSTAAHGPLGGDEKVHGERASTVGTRGPFP